jgi:hypothetical protein
LGIFSPVERVTRDVMPASMPTTVALAGYDGERRGYLGEVQLAVAVPERRPGVLRRRPGLLPRLVPGVAGLLLPESGVCGLQVPQRLLERDAGYLVEVTEVVGVFPLG